MKRPCASITASWGVDPTENPEIAAKYSRKVFDAGYNPICPILMLSTLIDDVIPRSIRTDRISSLISLDVPTHLWSVAPGLTKL